MNAVILSCNWSRPCSKTGIRPDSVSRSRYTSRAGLFSWSEVWKGYGPRPGSISVSISKSRSRSR